MKRSKPAELRAADADVVADVVALLEAARRLAARSVNAAMTAAYWSIGQRIVEQEQGGRGRAGYGDELVERLATDLTKRFGRGFGRRNLFQMKAFYLAYPQIVQTTSAESGDGEKVQTVSALSLVEKRARGSSLSVALVPLRAAAFGAQRSGA